MKRAGWCGRDAGRGPDVEWPRRQGDESLKLGVVFPQIEMGADPGAVRAYGQAVEQIGYHHILAYEHVVGANTASRPAWRGPYDIDSVFHEPFVLFGFLAGLTERIEFATGVVILPQRQTVLVAKQAAALDVLCGGRLRLGRSTRRRICG